MTELGRRAVVTGLAAIAVAGVAPALPVRAASAALEITPRALALVAPWHFAHRADGTITISQMGTFGFTNAPRPNGSPVFDCFLDGDHPSASPTFRALERAATFVAKHAYSIRTARRHPGAIYFDYTQRDPRRPFDDVFTEDAPPHPELKRIYALRGLDWYDT
jgi:hypothetical protein